MATELSFLPLNQTHHQNQTHQPPYPSNMATISGSGAGATWMWSPQPAFDDDSWEVRAFAEDTASAMGTTWPPRSYTCNFCRREFRSAQALGGHMNVHRRDRARLHQVLPPSAASYPASAASSAVFFQSQEFAANGGLCLFYQLPSPSNPNGVFTPATLNPSDASPSTLLSVSPYSAASASIGASLINNYPVLPPGFGAPNSKFNYCRRSEVITTSPSDDSRCNKGAAGEELDLELRLGQGPAS